MCTTHIMRQNALIADIIIMVVLYLKVVGLYGIFRILYLYAVYLKYVTIIAYQHISVKQVLCSYPTLAFYIEWVFGSRRYILAADGYVHHITLVIAE